MARSASPVSFSAREMGAERIIAMSRHESRQKLAREFGASDVVAERGDDAAVHIKDLTKGIGADSVLECVGIQESMMQAIRSARPGGFVAMSASRTASNSTAKSYSSLTYICTAARRRFAGISRN